MKLSWLCVSVEHYFHRSTSDRCADHRPHMHFCSGGSFSTESVQSDTLTNLEHRWTV